MSEIGLERPVQDQIINYAKEIGWKYLSPDEVLKLRGSYTNIFLKDIFISQLKKFNSFFNDEVASSVLKEIERIYSNIEGNYIFWQYLKGLKSVYIPSKKRNLNITLIDSKNYENNIFNITDEFKYTNGFKTIRQDIVFIINGIPLLFFETKSADVIEGINKAHDQIKRYHNDCPELLSIEQVFSLTYIIKFFYGATWNLSIKSLYNFREESEGNFEKLVKSFLDREKIIKLISDYILFTRKDDILQKVILRPHQIRAVEKIVSRAKDKLKKKRFNLAYTRFWKNLYNDSFSKKID